MKSLHGVVAVLTWIACQQSLAAQARVSFTFIDGHYAAEISQETLDKLPNWKPTDGDPPIPPREAIDAANRVFAAVYDPKLFPDWTVKFSRLELVARDREHWMWLAVYEASWKGGTLRERVEQPLYSSEPVVLQIPVLLSGKAVTPEFYRDSDLKDQELERAAERAAQVSPPMEGPWPYYCRGLLKRGTATVTAEMFAATPEWKLTEKTPPVSFANAYAAANPVQLSWLPPDDDWKTTLEKVCLEPLHENKWVWMFYFEQNFRGSGQEGPPIFIAVAVLMDGKAVDPVADEPKQ